MKDKVSKLYELVVKLRDAFAELSRTKEIENCGYGDEESPLYMLSDNACQKMDAIRHDIFKAIRKVKPDANLTFSK